MDPTEPPESSEEAPESSEERWRTVQPLPNWRKPTRQGLLARRPSLGIALVAVLVAGAALAVMAAVRAGRNTSAAGVVGGVLRVGVVGLPSLDPADARDPKAVMVVDQLFDTLVRNRGELEPSPGLAESYEANREQTVFTFRLSPEARFDDGTLLTSGDVKFTLERLARKGAESPLAAHLESVTGFAAFHTEGTAPGLAGVETPDPATVVIRLDRPFSSFPAVLGHPGFGVVPRAAVDRLGEAFRRTPVGSGPFRLVEAAGPGRLSLRRDRQQAPEGRIEGIDFVDFPNVEAAYAAFEDGTIDVAPVPPARAGDAAERFGRRGMSPYIGVVFYGMNLKNPDLANRRFRQAISLAIDRKKIVDEVYGGAVGLATGLVADGVPRRDGDACGDRCRHDPEEARRLLGEAFTPGSIPQVAVNHDDDPTQAAVAAEIKSDLDAVGIPTVLRPYPLAEYGKFLVGGHQELFRLGWIADYPSPDGFLTPLFSSKSPDNLTGVARTEIDEALAAARAEPDPEKRLALYLRVEQMVLDEYVVVPIAQLESRTVASPRVEGFDLDPIGTFDGAGVSLSSNGR